MVWGSAFSVREDYLSAQEDLMYGCIKPVATLGGAVSDVCVVHRKARFPAGPLQTDFVPSIVVYFDRADANQAFTTAEFHTELYHTLHDLKQKNSVR